MFQYQIWKKSLDVRYYIYVCTIIILAIFLQLYSFFTIREQGRVKTKTTELNTLIASSATTAQIDQVYADLDDLSDNYIQYLNTILALHILTLGYSVQDVLMVLYSSITDVYIMTYTVWELLNFVSSLTIIVWLIKHFGDFANNISDVRDELRAGTIIQRMEDDDSFNIKVTLAILLAIHYTRLVVSLQVSRTFGPMVRILKSLIIDIFVFLLLFAVMFAIFTGAGQVLFFELSGSYSDVGEAIRTLFASAIGEFDYGIYDGLTDVDPWVGYIFITVFLLLFHITLLNFLIAILSNTYDELNVVKNGLYLKNVISLRREYNKSPFDILLFWILPVSFYAKSRKLDEVISFIQYISYGFLSILFFFCTCVFLSPLAYVLILLYKIKHVAERPLLSKYDFTLRLLDTLIFFFVGIFFVLIWAFIDTANFTLSLFDTNIMPIDEYENESSMKISNDMDASKPKVVNDDQTNAMSNMTVYTAKSGGKDSNPIKDGLADTTLHILKACLKTMNEKHLKQIARDK